MADAFFSNINSKYNTKSSPAPAPAPAAQPKIVVGPAQPQQTLKVVPAGSPTIVNGKPQLQGGGAFVGPVLQPAAQTKVVQPARVVAPPVQKPKAPADTGVDPFFADLNKKYTVKSPAPVGSVNQMPLTVGGKGDDFGIGNVTDQNLQPAADLNDPFFANLGKTYKLGPVVGVDNTPAPVPPKPRSNEFPVGYGLSAADRKKAEDVLNNVAAQDRSRSSFFAPDPNGTIGVRDFIRELIPHSEGGKFQEGAISNVVRTTAQDILKTIADTGLSVLQAANEINRKLDRFQGISGNENWYNKVNDMLDHIDTSNDIAGKILFGGQELRPYAPQVAERIEAVNSYIDASGMDPKWKNYVPGVALLSVVGPEGLNLDFGLGGAEKKVGKEILEMLVDRYGKEVAEAIVKKGGKELANKALKEEGENIVREQGIKLFESKLDTIRSRPDLFQQTRALETLHPAGYEDFKVKEILKNFDEERLANNPITVGRFENGQEIVTSGHNRLEVLRRAEKQGLLTRPVDDFIKRIDYSGPGGMDNAIKESIGTNIANKSVKDVNVINLAINDRITPEQLTNALAFDETKVKYVQDIANTFKENDLVDFWNKSVGPRMAELKDLDFAAMQERLNFVSRVGKKIREVGNLTDSELQAVKDTIGDKIGQMLGNSPRTLSSVEKQIDEYLGSIKTGGFNTQKLTDLFGNVGSVTKVQKNSPAQSLLKVTEASGKSPVVDRATKKQLAFITERLRSNDPEYVQLAKSLGGSPSKTRELLSKMVEVGKQFDRKLTQWAKAKKEIDDVAVMVARAVPDAGVVTVPLKSKERGLIKILTEYDGDINRMADGARNTIIVNNRTDMYQLIDEFRQRGHIVKSTIEEPSPMGYRGVNIKYKTTNGVIAEIQINTPEIVYAKASHIDTAKSSLGEAMYNDIKARTGVEAVEGHRMYEEIRQILTKDTNKWTAEEAAQVERITVESQQYYDKLWNSEADRLASSSDIRLPEVKAEASSSPSTGPEVGSQSPLRQINDVNPPSEAGSNLNKTPSDSINVVSENSIDSASIARKRPVPAGELGRTSAGDVDPGSTSDIIKVKANRDPIYNPTHYNLTPEGRDTLEATIESARPELEKVKGGVLSNKEVIAAAERSEILRKSTTKSETLKREATVLRTRQYLAKMADDKGVSEDFVETLKLLKAEKSDWGRKLQSLQIGADPHDWSVKEEMINKILDLEDDIDKIIKAADGVDFTNAKEATEFYREFVPAKFTDYLTEYRYINLLSSPKTHIVNLFSNALQATVLNPTTKLASGALDSVGAALFRYEREHYVKEVPAYFRGMANSLGLASNNAIDALLGRQLLSRPDLRMIPAATGKYNPLTYGRYITNALEAGDQFFRTIIKGGEIEALSLKYRQLGKEVAIEQIEKEAADNAAYYVFRKPVDTTNKTEQGYLMTGIDNFTSVIQKSRRDFIFKKPGGGEVKLPNPVNWFIPFVETPMNILKQGIEYSPVGFLNVPGSAKKTESVAKAMIGSTVLAASAYIAMTGRSTWAVPTNEEDKAAFYASGRKPYSVKIGDTWVGYSKLGPLAFPIAMGAAWNFYWRENPKARTQTAGQRITAIIGGTAGFFADQSYLEGIANIERSLRGDVQYYGQIASSNVSQLVPLASLQRWITNIIDPVYRKPTKGFNLKAILENVEKGIPGLSTKLDSYKEPDGSPSMKPHNIANAFSPLDLAESKPEKEKVFNDQMQLRGIQAEEKIKRDKIKETAGVIYNEMKSLPSPERRKEYLTDKIQRKELTADMLTEIKRLKREEAVYGFDKVLAGSDTETRARWINDQLQLFDTKEERLAFLKDLQTKKILTDDVAGRMAQLKAEQ